MPKTTHYYNNGEVKIVWNPSLCTHSTKCWKGLRAVFDPTRKPWIDPLAAPTQAIVEQIRICPSGALSFEWINKSENPQTDKAD